MRFNTGISALMEFVNAAYKWDAAPRSALRPFVLLLAPYAPHLAEELWQVRPASSSAGMHSVAGMGAIVACRMWQVWLLVWQCIICGT